MSPTLTYTAAQHGMETSGATAWSDNPASFYAGSGDYHAAWRYASVNVPQGQALTSATHEIENISAINGAPIGLDYFANDVDDAPIINTAGRPSQMTLTTASVAFPSAPGTGSEITTITSVVQEIVDRAGWVALNDMVIVLFEDGTSGTDYLTMDNTAPIGTLEIIYPDASGPTLPSYHHPTPFPQLRR